MQDANMWVLDVIEMARKGQEGKLNLLRKVAAAADPSANPGEIRKCGLKPVELKLETRKALKNFLDESGVVTLNSLVRQT